jgi:hypothetical protein
MVARLGRLTRIALVPALALAASLLLVLAHAPAAHAAWGLLSQQPVTLGLSPGFTVDPLTGDALLSSNGCPLSIQRIPADGSAPPPPVDVTFGFDSTHLKLDPSTATIYAPTQHDIFFGCGGFDQVVAIDAATLTVQRTLTTDDVGGLQVVHAVGVGRRLYVLGYQQTGFFTTETPEIAAFDLDAPGTPLWRHPLWQVLHTIPACVPQYAGPTDFASLRNYFDLASAPGRPLVLFFGHLGGALSDPGTDPSCPAAPAGMLVDRPSLLALDPDTGEAQRVIARDSVETPLAAVQPGEEHGIRDAAVTVGQLLVAPDGTITISHAFPARDPASTQVGTGFMTLSPDGRVLRAWGWSPGRSPAGGFVDPSNCAHGLSGMAALGPAGTIVTLSPPDFFGFVLQRFGEGGDPRRCVLQPLPDARFDVAPASPAVGEPVTLDASASNAGAGQPDDHIARYEWDLDGDGSFETETPGPVAHTSFTAAGLTHVLLRVTDGFDESTVVHRDVAVGVPAPVAAFSLAPTAPRAGDAVTLDAGASSIARGGQIARYAWDLDGDGSFETDAGTSARIERRFPTPGARTLRLRVTSDAGVSAVDEHELVVADAPSAPAPPNAPVEPLAPERVPSPRAPALDHRAPRVSLHAAARLSRDHRLALTIGCPRGERRCDVRLRVSGRGLARPLAWRAGAAGGRRVIARLALPPRALHARRGALLVEVVVTDAAGNSTRRSVRVHPRASLPAAGGASPERAR